MHKKLRIVLNLLVFVLIIGFVWYMVNSLGKNEPVFGSINLTGEHSPYKKISSIKTKSEIIRFDLSGDFIFIAVNHAVMIYNKTGALVKQFPVEQEIRDIKVESNRIYLLYPAAIEVFTMEGEKTTGWKARRINSDYCSMALTSEYVFVTDAGNKNICKYTKDGDYLAVILSPDGFIIPSYAFDIINIRDTVYCGNSGRHRIESYTPEGEFIASFGKSGSEAGSFAGCCNPAYLAVTTNGNILTSEKGVPRISCFSRDGQFNAILLSGKTLGGGVKAYSVKVLDDRIYVAGKNTLSVFVYDPQLAARSACAGCPMDCKPLPAPPP